MADQKYKTPDELGAAVGKKIDELFGGFFADDQPESEIAPQKPSAKAQAPSQSVKPASPRPPVESSVTAAAKPVLAKAKPPLHEPQTSGPGESSTFRAITDKIEALFLTLDWEVTSDLINELGSHFRELDKFLPTAGPAKTIVNMNLRVLPKLAGPDSTPHPAWIKLLQDSVTALDQIYESGGKQPAQALITSITSNYREISAALAASSINAKTTRAVQAPAYGDPTDTQTTEIATDFQPIDPYGIEVGIETAVRSIEEVGRRLSRILGVLRQGGTMSPDEISRRLGVLEQLLIERLEKLSALSKELVRRQSVGALTETAETALGLFVWHGLMVAVPMSMLEAVIELTDAQSKQFSKKFSLLIGGKQIPRLPLKKPKNTKNIAPTCLIHLSGAGKEFFLLTNRFLGIRRAPQGADLQRETRLKIGPTTYTLINQAILKKS